MSIKAIIAAAVMVAGVGQAEAATGRCEYSGYYDPPLYGTKVRYDFDLFFRDGFIGNEENEIASYGPYTKDVAVPMRASITYLSADYCADVSLSSLGQGWDVTSSFMSASLNILAYGNSPDDGNFLFYMSHKEPSFLDLEYKVGEEYVWVLLGIDNVRISPVHLPATAALLPLGLGTLAVMKRRRRGLPACQR